MEFTIRKFDLLQELTLIQGVVERKTTIPILANVLVHAEGGELGSEVFREFQASECFQKFPKGPAFAGQRSAGRSADQFAAARALNPRRSAERESLDHFCPCGFRQPRPEQA